MKHTKLHNALILGAFLALGACGGEENDALHMPDAQTSDSLNQGETILEKLHQDECQRLPGYISLDKTRCPPIVDPRIIASGGQK